MNNSLIFTVLLWRTRNKKRARSAKELCKNYDLHQLIGETYVGKLRKGEHTKVRRWFADNFINKTDQFYLLCVCKSCHQDSVIYESKKEAIETRSFEIV